MNLATVIFYSPLYSPERQRRPGHLDEPQRQIPQWRPRHLDGHWDKTTGTRWVLCTIWLLVHLARGELAPRLSLVSPKVFSPLACLVGDTSFPAISSTWLHRYHLKRMAAIVLGSPVVLVFLLVFPVFLFVKHDQFHQGRTAEHLAEHTTISPTGFWLFGCFAEHSSRRSCSAF